MDAQTLTIYLEKSTYNFLTSYTKSLPADITWRTCDERIINPEVISLILRRAKDAYLVHSKMPYVQLHLSATDLSDLFIGLGGMALLLSTALTSMQHDNAFLRSQIEAQYQLMTSDQLRQMQMLLQQALDKQQQLGYNQPDTITKGCKGKFTP